MEIRNGAYGLLVVDSKVLTCVSSFHGRRIMNFPGGAIEPGESAEAALVREFREEVRITPVVHRRLYRSDDRTFLARDFPGTRLIYDYFLVSVPDLAIDLHGNSDDVEHLEWTEIEDPPPYGMLEVDRHVLDNLRAILES